MKKYIVIQWPEIQEYMDYPDFYDNSYLINDAKGLDDFGSSAYFVDTEWLQEIKVLKNNNSNVL